MEKISTINFDKYELLQLGCINKYMNIEIFGIKVDAIIGCHTHERVAPQIINIDIICTLYDKQHTTTNSNDSSNHYISDNITNTVCFDELIDYISSVVKNTNYYLLETLHTELTKQIFMQFKLIKEINLTLYKEQYCNLNDINNQKVQAMRINNISKRQFNVAIALGSNHEKLAKEQLIVAIDLLAEYLEHIKCANFYKTKPYGDLFQADFYNTVLIANTSLEPHILLAKLKTIEKLMGKNELHHNGPRIIDLDIIFIDDLILQSQFLNVPHARMHERDFVLKPLSEVAPTWLHPIYHKTPNSLLAELSSDKHYIINQA